MPGIFYKPVLSTRVGLGWSWSSNSGHSPSILSAVRMVISFIIFVLLHDISTVPIFENNKNEVKLKMENMNPRECEISQKLRSGTKQYLEECSTLGRFQGKTQESSSKDLPGRHLVLYMLGIASNQI